ncbi:MAG: hypothetical protein QME68_07020 [Elusimicrobiota bacterium]|nr:hypothetical protein [Elusimicrobiota bacterium]
MSAGCYQHYNITIIITINKINKLEMVRTRDVYLEIIKKLNKAQVKYVLIGASGINYYFDDPAKIILTADFDIFVRPEISNLHKVIKSLKENKFDLFVDGKLNNRIGKTKLKEIVEFRKTLRADDFYGHSIDICLDVTGYTFDQLYSDATVFTAGGIKVRVGKLSKLLHMKKLANRPKDRLFLKRYRLKA